MAGGIVMGLAWLMPDGETCRGFFKFLPRKFSLTLEDYHISEVTQVENFLMKENTTNHSNFTKLIHLRELQKDHILNDLILCISQSIGDNRYLRAPDSSELIPEPVIELAERLLEVRSKLHQHMGA